MSLIRELQVGEKIKEPGFYNIPLHQHHNQPCDGISVTSGVLRTMETAGPAQVWAHSKLNPNSRPVEATKAMTIGAAMAALIAGGVRELQSQFRVLNDNVPRYPDKNMWAAFNEGRASQAATLKACRAWREIDADPRPNLFMRDVDLLRSMAKELVKDPAATEVMTGYPECTMAAWDEKNQLWLLARPDTINPEQRRSSDYKKIATKGDPFTNDLVDRRVDSGEWGMQLAFASDVFRMITGSYLIENVIVAQWESWPHHVIPRPIPQSSIEEDIFRNRRAATRIRECLDANDWPVSELGPYKRSKYKSDHIRWQMQNEGYRHE